MALQVIRLLIFLSLCVTVYLAVVTLERCRSEKRFNFIYSLAGIFFYNLGYLIEMTAGNVGGGIIAIKIMYIGGCFMPAFFFFFVADYCELKIKKQVYTIPMLLFPALLYGVVATFDHHHLFYSEYLYDPHQPILGMQVKGSTLYLLPTLFSLVCIVVTCTILLRTMFRMAKSRRTGLLLLLAGSIAPVLAQVVYMLITLLGGGMSGVNLTAYVMVATDVLMYFTIVKSDLFDLAPKAYSVTLDLIRDAFILLDRDMNYSSSNRNAQKLFPGLESLPKGTNIAKLENWPEELARPDESEMAADGAHFAEAVKKEKQFVLPQRPHHNYSGWVNAVAGEDKKTVGWVVLIQDITETVNLINGIQAQRDEIAAMRDNLKEGLFLMDRDFTIQPSYSKALGKVLSGKEFEGKNFVGLLEKSFTEKDLGTVRDYFEMLFDGTVDVVLLEDINPLQEFKYISAETGEHKTLRGLFAVVDRGKGEKFILGTFEDITAETELKRKLAEEESRRQDEMRTIFELLQVEHRVFETFIKTPTTNSAASTRP
jgi:PAS domain-containing protein